MRKFLASDGDTWDSVAYKTTGDEFQCDAIRQLNEREYGDILVFEGGEILKIPEDVAKKSKFIKTPWEE